MSTNDESPPDQESINILYGAIKRRLMELQHDTMNHQPEEITVDSILQDIDLIIDAKILLALERFHLIKSVTLN